eukprot:UN15442
MKNMAGIRRVLCFTGNNKLILAEFDYTLRPRETFFFDQGKERQSMFHLTASVIPKIYWSNMVKGKWNGPNEYVGYTNPMRRDNITAPLTN